MMRDTRETGRPASSAGIRSKTEMYVWYGTNQFNFEVLPNPPSYEPTKCSKCGVVIKLGTEGYTMSGHGVLVQEVYLKEMQKRSE